MTNTGVHVPLTGVAVDADVRALGARVTVTQRYHNTESTAIEAVYVFPLDEGAAVCGFEALIDGVRVVGEVKERDEAFRVYDDAMAEGHGAYLLDEERPDVFQASVGNLPAGAKVELTIVYVVELGVDDGTVRFVVPTTVAPRYAPLEDTKGVGRPDADALNPPRALAVPYGLDLRVRLATPARPSRVSSPSHPIELSFEGDAVVVSLSQQGTPLDRDFVLAVEGGGFDVPTAWVETSPRGDRAVAVSFVPHLPDERRAAEIVFVVDRSGSMEGQSIHEVRNALQLCLRSMTAGCRFNIIGFGSRVQALFDETRAYDAASLAEATEHVRTLEADLGGTEILAPLELVFSKEPADGRVRQVVVLTDGMVSNTDAVLALVKRHASTHRVFAFGIGAGPSSHLVHGLARAGGGTAQFVSPFEHIEPMVLRLMNRLLSLTFSDVKVTWQGVDAVQAPAVLPPVFNGSRLVVYGFLKDAAAGSVRLEGTGAAGALSYEVPIAADAVPGLVVSTLAARARIRELEESPAWLQARGSRQQRPRRPSQASQEIIDLAIRYGLVSRETSYVAVERREVPVLGDVQLRKVPIALTHGWGGIQADSAGLMMHAAMPRAAFQSMMGPDEVPASLARRTVTLGGGVMDALSRVAAPLARRAGGGLRPGQPIEAAPRSSPDDSLRERMVALVELQRADGSWEPDAALAAIVGRPLSALVEIPSELAAAASASTAALVCAWATAVALAWLEVHARSLRAEWRLVADKGVDALRTIVPASDLAAWRAGAKALVS